MSTSSLYGSTGNVTVSANNLTTLYNATTGNVVTQNVPDRDFTTLYTKQSDIQPTRSYGNSNVEAFLNAGTDGANIVGNINANGSIDANGNLTINGITNLGPASNVHITGGNLNYVLQTDGAGNLNWVAQVGADSNSTPYTHFNVATTANNQQFTDSNLDNFANANVMAVFKNGVNIEPSLYEKVSNSVLQINILLNTGDTIDVLPSAGGSSGTTPGGNLTEIQYNGGAVLSGNASFRFDQPNSLMIVGQISTGNITGGDVSFDSATVIGSTNLGAVGNVHITGGTSGQFLSTDGSGNLSWSGTPVSVINANISNVHISGGTNGQVLSTDGSNNLSWTSYIANANFANTANYASYANIANTANSATLATSATTAGSATIAGAVTSNAQPNITSLGTLTAFASNGTVNFTNASNVALGANSNIHITGGSTGQVLSTDGSGNLSWLSVVVGTPNYANFAGTVVNSSQPNITSTGTLTDLTVSGNVIVQRAYEKFTTVGTGATGTINFNMLDQSILYYSANATANFTLNFRGNGTTTFNSSLPTNDAVTLVLLNTVGATAYIANTIQIDGSNVTPIYVNGSNPSTGTRLANSKQSYTYTVMKTGSSTYTVLGSFAEYQ